MTTLLLGEKTLYKIPDEIPKFKDPFDHEAFTSRDRYIREGMFAFVSWKWVNPFVKWINNRKCLEVMAGRGILASALRQKGVNIIATDDYSWARNGNDQFRLWKDTVTDVEEMDAIEVVNKYGKDIDILIMSWPYMDDTAYKVIQRLHEVNPFAQVAYIGESEGGCTADDTFFDHFKQIEDEGFDEVKINFERWNELHDRPMLGQYTKVAMKV